MGVGLAGDVETARVGEDSLVPVGDGGGEEHRLPGPYRHSADVDVGAGVSWTPAVAERKRSHDLLDGAFDQSGIAAKGVELVRVGEQKHCAVVDACRRTRVSGQKQRGSQDGDVVVAQLSLALGGNEGRDHIVARFAALMLDVL